MNRPPKNRSLRLTLLGPLSLIVTLLILSLIYIVGIVNRQYNVLQNRIGASWELTAVIVDVLKIQSRQRENLVEYQSYGNQALLRRIERLQARRQKFLAEAINSHLINAQQRKTLESYNEGLESLAPITKQFTDAVRLAQTAKSGLLLESILSLREIIDARLTDLLTSTRNDLIQAKEEMNNLLAGALFYIASLLLVSIIVLWGTAMLYRKQVLRPLQFLNRGLRSASIGNLNHRLKLENTPQEIQEVVFNFNAMAASLKKLTTDLDAARIEAIEAADAKSRFLANMSHDIRTPMNTIVGMVQLLTRTKLTPEQSEQANILKKSSQFLLGLINDFLDHAKLDAGELVLSYEAFHLLESLERVSEVIRPLIEQKGLELRLQVSADLPKQVIGDGRRLEQIMMNLLSNAAKFTKEGYVSFSVIAIRDGRNPKLVIEVSDSGIGLKKEHQAHIFDRFSQIKQSNKDHPGGSGLGLSIVKQFVDLMDGTIEVSSEEGKGTTFKVMVPMVECNSPQIDDGEGIHEFEAIKPSSRYQKMLLVDDVPENRFLVKAFLKDSGIDIVEAENGEEAFKLFQKHQPDIVLMDMRMPVLDGFNATQKIRMHESKIKAKRVPIIALTASALPDEIARSLDAGCDLHLIKPITIPDLQKALADGSSLSQPR